MQTISYSEARENLKSVIDKVVADRAPIAITRQRGEGVVIISESEWAGMEETLYLLASPANAKHLIDVAWADGLKESRARRHGGDIDKEGPLLDPAGALPRPALPPGTYRCRVIKLGFGNSGRGNAFQTFKPFTCFVSVEESLLVFIKATGSDLPAGRLWDDGDTRLVFLGATAAKPGVPAPAYGTQPQRDRSGVIERVGDFRWRLVSPWQSKDARIEVMELVPDTPAVPVATGG